MKFLHNTFYFNVPIYESCLKLYLFYSKLIGIFVREFLRQEHRLVYNTESQDEWPVIAPRVSQMIILLDKLMLIIYSLQQRTIIDCVTNEWDHFSDRPTEKCCMNSLDWSFCFGPVVRLSFILGYKK